MTIVEKAAYLKGLTDGLGIDPQSNDGKLWGALCDLVSDIAHEIEDLQDTTLDFADTLDEIGEELGYLEEITGESDFSDDEDFDCDGDCSGCGGCDFRIVDDEDEVEDDEEIEYDGIIYDVTCPKCGEEISFDEETLDNGSITCPQCGENLEFDLDTLDSEDKE